MAWAMLVVILLVIWFFVYAVMDTNENSDEKKPSGRALLGTLCLALFVFLFLALVWGGGAKRS